MNSAILGLLRPQAFADARLRNYGTFHPTVAAISGTAPGQNTQNIQISGQPFVAVALTFSAIVNSAQATRPNILLQITDSVTLEAMFNIPLPIWSVAGDAYNPAILALPQLYAPNNSIAVNVLNYEANTADVRVTMIGYRQN